MSDLWNDEGFGGAALGESGEDDWDEGDEDAEGGLEDGFDDPDGESDEEDWGEGQDEDE